MRQIKFRALAVVNDKRNDIKIGDFVYGSFIQSGVDAPCIIFGDGEQIEIDIDTVGQLTGFADKNRVDIYEGDIIKGWCHDKQKLFTVEYESCHCEFVARCNGEIGSIKVWYDGLYVVGNTHQNSELNWR